MEFFYILDNIIYDWGFVCDGIGRGWGEEKIIGGEAAPDGVLIEEILVYKERGGGGCL